MSERVARFFSIPFSVRLAWTLWVVLVAAIGVRVAVSKPTSQTVVPIYLAAGERWLHGESLYGPAQLLDVYRNPPVVAAGFATLTPLPEKLAGLIVRGVGVALFLTGLRRVRRELLPEWGPSRVGWLFALAVIPAVPAANNGQLNLHLAALAFHGVASAAAGRWSASAAWIGVAVWVKVYPLSLGLLVALVAPPRYAVTLVGVVLLGGLLPFALDDLATASTQYAEYAHYLKIDDRTHDDLSRVPRDWTAIPRAWLGWVSPEPVTKAVSLAVATGLAVLMLVRRRRPLGESLLAALVGSHVWMTAFGPATVADAQAWSGLQGLREVMEALRPSLVTLRDERGRELFDLPDAPRPDEDTVAPIRLLPEFDNLIVSRADARFVSDEHRKSIFLSALRVLPTVLIDGFAAATWKTERKKAAATLVITPFAALTKPIRGAVEEEASALLRFLEGDATTFAVDFAAPA